MSTWRPFPFCERYEVSDEGQVRHAVTGRVMSGGINAHGYRQVSFRPDGKHGRHVGYTVHRMVALTFIGPRPEGHSVDHINRDRSDNRLVNLRYIAERDNCAQGGAWHRGRKKTVEHAAKVGASMRGERHPMAKLTDLQASEIAIRRMAGESRKELSRVFGVSPSRVSQLANARKRLPIGTGLRR